MTNCACCKKSINESLQQFGDIRYPVCLSCFLQKHECCACSGEAFIQIIEDDYFKYSYCPVCDGSGILSGYESHMSVVDIAAAVLDIETV